MSDVSRSPCLFGVCDDNETIPYWSGDTTLGGKVGWGAARADNEGQTLADFSLVAVGGWRLEAIAAGGLPTRAGGGKGGGEGGGRRGRKTPATKMRREKKTQAEMKKGNGSLQKINKDRRFAAHRG